MSKVEVRNLYIDPKGTPLMAPRPSTLTRRTTHHMVTKLKTGAAKAMTVSTRVITLDRAFVAAVEEVYLDGKFNNHPAATLVQDVANGLKGRKLPSWNNAAVEAALNHLEETNSKIKLPM